MKNRGRSESKSDLDRALEWADAIRGSEMGHSANEKMIIVLADEVVRLRREAKRPSAQKPTHGGLTECDMHEDESR